MFQITNSRRACDARAVCPISLLSIAGFLIYTASALGADSESEADPPAQSVGEVQVTVTRAERDILDTPGNVTVIDREQIERSGLRDVPELLRRLAEAALKRKETK